MGWDRIGWNWLFRESALWKVADRLGPDRLELAGTGRDGAAARRRRDCGLGVSWISE